jgi:hypothetical protein
VGILVPELAGKSLWVAYFEGGDWQSRRACNRLGVTHVGFPIGLSGANLMDADELQQLPEQVLFRIHRGDATGRAFGTPRNPKAPTLQEFNPRLVEVRAGDLAVLIVQRRHGIFPDQALRISQLDNGEIARFRNEDPISAVKVNDGLSLTGGHHRTHEMIQRVAAGTMSPDAVVRILLHD